MVFGRLTPGKELVERQGGRIQDHEIVGFAHVAITTVAHAHQGHPGIQVERRPEFARVVVHEEQPDVRLAGEKVAPFLADEGRDAGPAKSQEFRLPFQDDFGVRVLIFGLFPKKVGDGLQSRLLIFSRLPSKFQPLPEFTPPSHQFRVGANSHHHGDGIRNGPRADLQPRALFEVPRPKAGGRYQPLEGSAASPE